MSDTLEAFRILGRFVRRLARTGALAPAVIVLVMAILVGLACIGLGDTLAGETGAWVGAAIGVVVGGLFTDRMLDEL